ncbi:MAG: rRNA maturation RNase YbeY [Bacillaceae bacterium]
MNLYIDMFDETEQLKEAAMDEVKKLVMHAASVEELTDEAELSITFVDNDRIQEINRDYRNKDVPTDVISFALEEMGEDEMEYEKGEVARMLGDIIISIPRAKEQAEEYGHSFERELGFLAVHGFLHLLGYDHMTEEEEKVMFGKQKQILDSYGLTRE